MERRVAQQKGHPFDQGVPAYQVSPPTIQWQLRACCCGRAVIRVQNVIYSISFPVARQTTIDVLLAEIQL